MEVLCLSFSLLQACVHLLFALFDQLLLDCFLDQLLLVCFDAGLVEAFEHFLDDLLEECLTFRKLLDAWILDTALSGGVVDLHLVRRVLVGLHAVGNQVDVEVPFVVLGYLDVGFDVLRHGKVIGCNLIELV